METQPDYSEWSKDELIGRVTHLEQQLQARVAKEKSAYRAPENQPSTPNTIRSRINREFDPLKYSTRFIALKFAYLGQRYNGLEFHANTKTRLPTVEEELWKALSKARLVFPTPNPLLAPEEPNWEGCEYSKCGRTDKGVSAFGQVIGIRVRSNRPISQAQAPRSRDDAVINGDVEMLRNGGGSGIAAPFVDTETTLADGHTSANASTSDRSDEESTSFHPINDEIPYCQVLNRLLPPDIRILAWCPNPPSDFSARFSCKERRYKYFFTQPAFAPTIGAIGLKRTSTTPEPQEGRRREGWLDIHAMRQAAHEFVGLHDFRNFCRVDSSKQIENFERRIFHADIEELDPQHNPVGYVSTPGFQQHENPGATPGSRLPNAFVMPQTFTPTLYAFTLHGSAFLWHQVRHMIAILFLIGQGLEKPSLVRELLDVKNNPCKPQYEMADDAPLVLWDCIFAREGSPSREDALDWVYVGDYTGSEQGLVKSGGRKGDSKYGMSGIVDDMWNVWRRRKMDEVLAGTLSDVIVGQNRIGTVEEAIEREGRDEKQSRSQKVFQGGDGARLVGRYIPVMEKPKMESVETINAKYGKRKGFEQSEVMREQGFRRLAVDT